MQLQRYINGCEVELSFCKNGEERVKDRVLSILMDSYEERVMEKIDRTLRETDD